jgi:hypothetical protein
MYNNDFIETEPGISDQDIDNVEHAYSFVFPKQFRDHYLRYNGGSPNKYLFKRDDVIFVVHQFLPIRYGRHRFEESFRNLKVEASILPADLVPFGMDPGGDYYCFSTGPKQYGSIWMYRGEYDDPASAREKLADSLVEFIERMEADED